MSNGFSAPDSSPDHEPVDEDRPADPDETDLGPVPDDERPLDPSDLADESPLDDDRRVRLDAEDDDEDEF